METIINDKKEVPRRDRYSHLSGVRLWAVTTASRIEAKDPKKSLLLQGLTSSLLWCLCDHGLLEGGQVCHNGGTLCEAAPWVDGRSHTCW